MFLVPWLWVSALRNLFLSAPQARRRGQLTRTKGCGAFTGETSVEQMKDMDLDQVLPGHSGAQHMSTPQ